jgi:hypothetical protein
MIEADSIHFGGLQISLLTKADNQSAPRDGSIVRRSEFDIEGDRESYTEVVVFASYVPSL